MKWRGRIPICKICRGPCPFLFIDLLGRAMLKGWRKAQIRFPKLLRGSSPIFTETQWDFQKCSKTPTSSIQSWLGSWNALSPMWRQHRLAQLMGISPPAFHPLSKSSSLQTYCLCTGKWSKAVWDLGQLEYILYTHFVLKPFSVVDTSWPFFQKWSGFIVLFPCKAKEVGRYIENIPLPSVFPHKQVQNFSSLGCYCLPTPLLRNLLLGCNTHCTAMSICFCVSGHM